MSASARLAGLVAFCAAVGTAGTASAQSAASVEYSAPASCPSEDDVTARIAAHRSPGERARIGIERNAKGGYHGDLLLVGSDGTERVHRAVDAQTCGAVVEAIALVAALAPHAAASDGDGGGVPADGRPRVEEATAPSEPSSAPAAVDPPAASRSNVDAPTKVTVSRARSTRFVVGANPLTGTSFGAGRWMVGFGVFAEADGSSNLFDAPLLQPSARISIGGTLPTTSGDRTLDWGSCSDCGPQVRLITLALDLCPIGAGHHDRIGFAVCAHNEIGSIVARAGGRVASDTRLWGAIGPLARARFVVNRPRGGITEPGSIFVEVAGGGLAPVRRDAFYFYDIGSAFLAPSFLWTAAIGVGAVLQ